MVTIQKNINNGLKITDYIKEKYFFFQMFCPWLKKFVVKRSPVFDVRLDPKHNPKIHLPNHDKSDGSEDEDDQH